MQKIWKVLLCSFPVILCTAAVLLSHAGKKPEMHQIPAQTETDRENILLSMGYRGELLHSQAVTVPEVFDSIYEDYAAMQTQQMLPLAQFAGAHAVLYTYQLKDSEQFAELLTSDGFLIGVQCYDPEVSS